VSKLYKSSLVWLRRDLRVYDNAALFHALESSEQVFPVFIFDPEILNRLENKEDRRVEFIWESINELKESLNQLDSDIIVRLGNPIEVIPQLCKEFSIDAVFCNKDYEDYAVNRDENIKKILKIDFLSYKDQVIFEEKEILTGAEKPYTVFSPYRNNHLKKIELIVKVTNIVLQNLMSVQ
jgi:deoxyribodipyrimidine photo-lyase